MIPTFIVSPSALRFSEAYEAGRDIGPLAAAITVWAQRARDGKATKQASQSVAVTWQRLCDESWAEINVSNAVLNAWMKAVEGPEVFRRATHIAGVTGHMQRRLVSHKGTHGVHWHAMRMRRYIRLLGLEDRYMAKVQADIESKERAAVTRQATKERKAKEHAEESRRLREAVDVVVSL